MNMERHRLQNIALKKVQQEQEPITHICGACGQSSSFSFNFQIEQPTKTCFECGFVDTVKEEQEEAA